jgi:hypothetical protein
LEEAVGVALALSVRLQPDQLLGREGLALNLVSLEQQHIMQVAVVLEAEPAQQVAWAELGVVVMVQ